jgi:hypothetical protein
MSTAVQPDWLQRLSAATTYQELQAAFNEIVMQAQSGVDSARLAASIDEAIRRLEQERARDEQELQEIQARYDAFKQQQSGVVGWFKRHIPFTETRRQEVEHRGDVADQAAEILADNLVIARAQMIKERLLGPDDRRMGLRPGQWQSRLDEHQAVDQLQPLGLSLRDMAGEVERSQAFLAEIKQDIEGFAGANFKTAEDRGRRDADLQAARQELAVLERELQEETLLKANGLKRLCCLVVDELGAGDAAFRADTERLEQLQGAQDRLDQARAALSRLRAEAGKIGGLARELEELPQKIRQFEDSLRKTESQRAAAQAEALKKTAILDDRRLLYEDAQRAHLSAQQSLQVARQFYEAYLAERGAAAAPGTQAEVSDSPVAWQYEEAKQAAQAAEENFRAGSSPFETAQREAELAQSALEKLSLQIESQRRELSALEQKAPQLRSEMASVAHRAQADFDSAATALAWYLGAPAVDAAPALRPDELAMGHAGWISSQGLQRPLADALLRSEHDPRRHGQATAVLERVAKWLDAHQQAIGQDRSAATARRTAAWQRRCRELLGDDLAIEACKGGLP